MSDGVLKPTAMTRRAAGALALTAAGAFLAGLGISASRPAGAVPLRPPGALANGDFTSACIRCFQCGSVCPNQCIQFKTLADGVEQSFTPYIKPREQACILCMRCTEACPTDALTPIGAGAEDLLAEVRMGTAVIDEHMCYSFNNRPCGVCYYACPFPNQALKLGSYARPEVDPEFCVGCGNCERACIHLPQAVRIIPAGNKGART